MPRAVPPLLVGFLGLALASAVQVTPPLIVIAAALPVLVYAVPLVVVGRRAGEPFVLLLGAFLWGAVVATWIALVVNDALLPWAPELTPVLLGPLVEESAKAAGLVLLLRVRPTSFASVARGIVYGGLVGLGFVLTENLGYLLLATLAGGEPGLARAVWTRGVLGGFHHAVFTACAGVGLVLRHGSAGFAAAVAQHVVWNVVAAGRISDILCNAPAPGGSCAPSPSAAGLYVWIPLVVVGVLGPGIAALIYVSRPDSRRSTTSSA